MKRFGWLISKYLVQAILPYFVFSWLLLSVILFVQQASRYSDIFFSVNLPKNLIWQLSIALIPNVIAFTCPMAVLVGVIIGLSRMLGDSELVAIRSAGVGNFLISIPIIFLSLILSVFTFLINLYGVPFAAQIVRQVAFQTALHKLESPIEPGVFNSEINGYTIYVKNGDFNKGTWENIFIYNEDKNSGDVRLITSKNGRIDSTAENSELVLDNAIVSTVSLQQNKSKLISENVGRFRLAINTKRGELIEKLNKLETTPEELGLIELIRYANEKSGKEKTEAQILWQRRILLSITPLIFALLGTALVLRFKRGGRGIGIVLALVGLIFYYLITLLGEQLARTNSINVLTAGLIPLVVSISVISYLFLAARLPLSIKIENAWHRIKNSFPFSAANLRREIDKFGRSKSHFRVSSVFKVNILDFDIIYNLIKYFLLTVVFLTTIYVIFTAFELWKFVGEINGGFLLLMQYLFYLQPFIYLQLAPSALMIATLTTFVIKSRQNEIVSWTAAGRSVYRLLLPCFGLMIFIGVFNWAIQETIAPETNKIQDELRAKIRSRGLVVKKEGKLWVANNRRIYSFEFADNRNDSTNKVKNLSIFEFSDDETQLQSVYKIPEAVWEKDKIKYLQTSEKLSLNNGKFEVARISGELTENVNPFNNLAEKPNHLTRQQLIEKIQNSESETEKRNLEISLEKNYTTLILPFVITLFTAPFALSLSRKGRVVTIGYAVGVWLLFMGISMSFEQYGVNGFISPAIAVWSPLFLFTVIGVFLLSRVRT